MDPEMSIRRAPLVGLAKEGVSLENPTDCDPRVALLPDSVRALSNAGISVLVEEGAGSRLGISDDSYRGSGAQIVDTASLFTRADIVTKLKAPALDNVSKMKKGSIVFCMAHAESFPARVVEFEKLKINLVGMENLLDHFSQPSDDELAGAVAIALGFGNQSPTLFDLVVVGFSPIIAAAIRYAAQLGVASIRVLHPSRISESEIFDRDNTLVIHDDVSSTKLQNLTRARVLSLDRYRTREVLNSVRLLKSLVSTPNPKMRRIQSLRETGICGAAHGLQLSNRLASTKEALRHACVLGYGHVAMGALEVLVENGVETFVLGRRQTAPGEIEKWLASARLIINGAELRRNEIRRFLITQQHCDTVVAPGSVIVDLIGGSPVNRSPVEPITQMTYPDAPDFERNGRWYSAVWGWGILGKARETAEQYSRQILSVLLTDEKLVNPISTWPTNLLAAMVSGPFGADSAVSEYESA